VITIGDIHIYVSEFEAALRFWAEGLGLTVAERESSAHSAFARLDFPEDGPSLQIVAPVDRWEPDLRPEPGTRPSIGFDVVTTDFDDLLVRLLEHGGRQEGEIENYNDLRVVTVTDPDGNAIDLIEIPPDAA
jgi:catechol 2,3-dioxygenase-like lactoylglutathione lyase family enzyme